MQLYIYVSIAVVVLTTVTLFVMFKRKNLMDYRYQLGLVISAVLACAASLFFPKLLTVFSVNMALQFVLSLFIALLLYIFLLFLILMLVSAFVSKDKLDRLMEKWEQKKLEAKNTREFKKKEKEVAAEAKQKQTDTIVQVQQAEKAENIIIPEREAAIEIHEKVDNMQPSGEEKLYMGQEQTKQVQSSADIPEESAATEIVETSNEVHQRSEENVSENDYQNETVIENALLDNAVFSLANTLENNDKTEKNVDTSDIIDKMGLDTGTIEGVSDLQGLSLDESIERAFLLKQEGREMEAAALYMDALDKKPDNETVFWIVLDLCAIYKTAGHADLAEDILLTYVEEYEELMSEAVKDQILQSLYNN